MVAQDLLMQTVREQKIDVVTIVEPYRNLDYQTWEADAFGKAAIWSCFKYAIAIWGDALKIAQYYRKMEAVYRLTALWVSSPYRTLSTDAVCVIAGMTPIRIPAEDRRTHYEQTKLPLEHRRQRRREAHIESSIKWQGGWDKWTKGRWTHRLIPQIDR